MRPVLLSCLSAMRTAAADRVPWRVQSGAVGAERGRGKMRGRVAWGRGGLRAQPQGCRVRWRVEYRNDWMDLWLNCMYHGLLCFRKEL